MYIPKVGNLVIFVVRVTRLTSTCRGEWYLLYDDGHIERPAMESCVSKVPNLKAELLNGTMCVRNTWSFSYFLPPPPTSYSEGLNSTYHLSGYRSRFVFSRFLLQIRSLFVVLFS